MAEALAARNIDALYSYAGRVQSPKKQPVAVRTGGFGGADGLADFLRVENFTHLIDATHPFAGQMSRNAVMATEHAGISLLALTRPHWKPVEGDRWQRVSDIESAVNALSGPARKVMLAIGRMQLEAFASQPQHHYLLRLVDAPENALPLPDCTVMVDRGPFTVENDIALLRQHRIDLIVSKNSGGDGAAAKLVAARQLGLQVLMIDRPALPMRAEVHSVAEVLDWLHHRTDLGV